MPTLWGSAGNRVCWDYLTRLQGWERRTPEELFCHVLSVKPSAAGQGWSGETEQWVTAVLMDAHPVELLCQSTKACDGAGQGTAGQGAALGNGELRLGTK